MKEKQLFTYDFEAYQPYNSRSKSNIESECADITFINSTDGEVFINNFLLAINGTLVLGANQNELNVSKFQLTNSTSTTGNVYVIRKRYL